VVKRAAPSTASRERVPARVSLPGLAPSATSIRAVEGVVFPYTSWTATSTGARASPAVAVAGCTVKAIRAGVLGLTSKVALVAAWRLPDVARRV
jgi:hypothetical protein